MASFLAILSMVGPAIGGGLFTLICLHIFVPLIVRGIGEEKFADMGGLEPCSTTIFSAIAGGLLYSLCAEKWGLVPALLVFPALSFLCVVYFVLWLKFATFGKSKREFKIENDQIIRIKDSQSLHPTYARMHVDYFQTDAFHGYSTYTLLLCDGTEVLAKNGYVNAEQKDLALSNILQVCNGNCGFLDIIFVRRETDTLWWQVQLSQDQAELLCGPLSALSDESRAWWRQWLRPRFPEDGLSKISAAELEKHLDALKSAYPVLIRPEDRPQPAPEVLEVQMRQLDRRTEFDKLVELSREYGKAEANDWILLEMLLRRNTAHIEIMTKKRFDNEIMAVAQNGASLLYRSYNDHRDALAVTIQPR